MYYGFVVKTMPMSTLTSRYIVKKCHNITTKGARLVWPVSRGRLLLHGTSSYLHICRRSVLPYIRFCICPLDYDYVLYIINFAILYSHCYTVGLKYSLHFQYCHCTHMEIQYPVSWSSVLVVYGKVYLIYDAIGKLDLYRYSTFTQ
jgi:hypothetical protein